MAEAKREDFEARILEEVVNFMEKTISRMDEESPSATEAIKAFPNTVLAASQIMKMRKNTSRDSLEDVYKSLFGVKEDE